MPMESRAEWLLLALAVPSIPVVELLSRHAELPKDPTQEVAPDRKRVLRME